MVEIDIQHATINKNAKCVLENNNKKRTNTTRWREKIGASVDSLFLILEEGGYFTLLC
jgi:hypothetical protein